MRERLRASDQYDLIILGGGITGCGVAYEAAARGARVLLLEQEDFAAGTSSRSTKLIHGGIRYLKQFDFRLVREGVHERQNLIDAVPYLVHPVQFIYPVHQGDPDPLFALRIGLLLYDWFAGRRNLLRHKLLSGRALLAEEPNLREAGLKGGALYADCLTDDARLTVEVAKAAAAQGAVLLNYMPVRRFLYSPEGRVKGVEAIDGLTGERVQAVASAVLNATGPWVDLVRELDEPACEPILRPTKGVHIAVAHERLPIRRPVVMHAEDGRLMFAVPRDGLTYLGTTDTDYAGDPGVVSVEREDVTYILAAANRMFPRAELTERDVVSAWAGLRSLAAASPQAGPSQVSRDYRLYTSPSGIVSVAGGKLTAFQAMARSIVRFMLPSLPGHVVPLKLAGAMVSPPAPDLLSAEFGLSTSSAQAVLSRHGAEALEVLAYLDPKIVGERARTLAAEACFAVEREFAVKLTDVLARRTSQLLFSRDNGMDVALLVARTMAGRLGWDQQEQASQVADYVATVGEMSAWRAGQGAPTRV